MGKKGLLFVIVGLTVGLCGLLFAQVPRTKTYQGRLTDETGTPLIGSHNITFSLYTVDVGGTAIFFMDNEKKT